MNPRSPAQLTTTMGANRRLHLWYGVLLLIVAIFIARLFYLQIIKHDYYHQKALSSQLKEYVIAPERGAIKAYENGSLAPLVLNEKLYTLYADPAFVKKVSETARKLAVVTKGDVTEYAKLMRTPKTRYVVLTKRLPETQKKQIMALKLPGIGIQTQHYRTYPQGSLAAQLLGFVNNDGEGKYGVEQTLNKTLSGKPGKLKAITDAQGIPLAASKENIQIDPIAGHEVVLTIDLVMQKQLENILKEGLERVQSDSGSAVIIDPNSGAIKAMANYPTYDPAQYFKVTDPQVFNNAVVSSPLEVGSVMKPLTAAAALDQGVIKPDTRYYDPGRWQLDGHVITNIEEVGGPGTYTIADILNKSINTGATWMLMQMGGGEINEQARTRWHDYMVNRYQFSKLTGVEQGYEAGGDIPVPTKGDALSLTYANTSFGQAMTATPLQMAAALASVVNGGTYWRPQLVDATIDATGIKKDKVPEIIHRNVVSPAVSQALRSLLEYVVANHKIAPPFPPNYSVGGKTGTAQIANPAGGYFGDKYNGTYIGFIGGDQPEYVIAVRVNEPRIGKYAGSAAAQPIFGRLGHLLIQNFNVTPKTTP